MRSRERVTAALEFRPPDVIPLRILPAPGGLHEHGQKLVDLHRECGHDFGDLSGLALPKPPGPEDHDADGRYHSFVTDGWGTTWEYRIFGVWGHPVEWPLNDLSKLDAYTPPAPPAKDGPHVDAARESITEQMKTYYTLGGGGSLFETLHSLRRFEDVLIDIALDTPEINRIEDMILDHARGCVAHSLAIGVDGVCFGDDYGTQDALLVSPEVWRRFFKPRYRELFDTVKQAGKRVFFHCCGYIDPILEDFAELGVDAVWPQLTAFDRPALARRCRDLGMAVELHPDRGDLMQRGTPERVREYVLRLVDEFHWQDGGAWLYIEIDPGFPYANVEALFAVAQELRGRV